MKRLLLSLLLIAIASSVFSQRRFLAFEQSRVTAEVRPAINFSAEKMEGTEVKIGYGVEATGAYRLLRHLGVYGGWGWNQFDTDDAYGIAGISFQETGFTFGLQYLKQIENYPVAYVLRGGALYNTLRASDSNGNTYTSDGAIGVQAEAGLEIRFGSAWLVKPSFRYRRQAHPMEFGQMEKEVDLNYLSLGISLGWWY